MTRVPVVLGLGRRSGAGTVAAALHATECCLPPVVSPGNCSADIAVCAGDEAALGSADAVRGATVLLVVLVDDTTPPTHARQQELARRHGSVVVLPHVREWAGLSGVPDEAAALFTRQPGQLSPALCAYTRGLRLAVAALLRTGALTRPRPPALTWFPPTTWSPATSRCPVRPAPPIRRTTAQGCLDAPACPQPSAPPTPAPAPAHDRPRAAPTDPAPAAQAGPATRPTPADPAPISPASAAPGPAGAAPALVLDDEAIEAEVLAAATPESEPTAAAGPTLGRTAGHLHIRAFHRPVMGPVRVESAKAG